MSEQQKQPGNDPKGGTIIIHPPLTGDPDALAAFNGGEVRPVVEPAARAEPAPAQPVRGDREAPPPAAPPAPRGERALGLDAMRGFMLLAMTFAMTVPFGAYALWMYHMQNPPPNGAFVEVPGITWRDLLFPGFLFTMAAAIPITNTLRINRGMPYPGVIFGVLKRAALLYVFALIIGHVNPYWTEDYTRRGNLMAIVGFLICWPLFTRRLPSWSDATYRAVRTTGWILAAALLFAGPLIYGATFDIARRDGIIAAIAICSLLAVCIWLPTRSRPGIRIAVIAAIAAAKLAATTPGWVQEVYYATPAPWLYEAWYLELMIIVLGGTLVGDLLLQWMKPRAPSDVAHEWPAYRLVALALLSAAFLPIALIGLFNRDVGATAGLTIALSIAGMFLVMQPRSERDRVLAKLFIWSAFWLVLGLILEPFEGGIKKVPQTLSYLTLATGLSIATLIVALITTDVLRSTSRILKPIVDIGQNPLLAYIVFMLFLNHIAFGLGIGGIGTDVWWQATIRGLIFTILAGLIVWYATRRRLYWRA